MKNSVRNTVVIEGADLQAGKCTQDNTNEKFSSAIGGLRPQFIEKKLAELGVQHSGKFYRDVLICFKQ